MRSEFMKKFGRVTPSLKPAVLLYIYKNFTGDSSSSENSSQGEIDKRVMQEIEMEDPDIVLDLKALQLW